MNEDNRKMILRRKPLDEEMWSIHHGRELTGLIALIKRIKDYWEIATFSQYFTMVPEDDQALYDTFISDLSFLLARVSLRPELEQLINESIPQEFIDSELAVAMDDDIKGSIKDGFNRTISALRRESIHQNAPIFEDDPTDLFSLFDDELRAIHENNLEHVQEAEFRYGLRKQPDEQTQLAKSLENLEKTMRQVIADALPNDWGRVPRDIREKAEKRYVKEQRRNPMLTVSNAIEKLGYCDLGDLETIIIAGNNWMEFEQILGPKPELRNRFQLLTPYRNARAHHREPDESAVQDARSAITWFMTRLPRS